MSTHDRLPLPDILRSTELHDFGDSFRTSRRPARTLVVILALAGLLALGQLITHESVEVAGGSSTAAADLDRS